MTAAFTLEAASDVGTHGLLFEPIVYGNQIYSICMAFHWLQYPISLLCIG